AGWSYATTIVWDEDNVSTTAARGSPDSPSAPHIFARVEMVLVVCKGDWNLRRVAPHDLEHTEWLEWTNGVWRFPGERRAMGHPAPFPEELPRRLLKLFSFREDVVLDPFLGSGTTAVVCHQLGRTFYGFDTSADYVALARRRLVAELAA
ncbi:MAG TPA: site-specific DNA-methyltransferase, partial [Povalibacter sp.]|nr:site-specific DNA-methyltransferase [Povalibacter sp.]